MAKFSVTEEVTYTYTVNIDSDDYEIVERGRAGEVDDDELFAVLDAGDANPPVTVHERQIEEV